MAAVLTATGCGRFAFEPPAVTGDADDAPTDALAAFEAPSLIAER